MELFLRYIKMRCRIFTVYALFGSVFMLSFVLYHLPFKAVAYPIIVCLFLGSIILIFDYQRVKLEHEKLKRITGIYDLSPENFPKTNEVKDEDYQRIINMLKCEYNEYCAETNRKYSDMIDYYTVWVHQIKTPISSMRLNLQNEDSPLSRKLTTDLHRIEQYVEMVLTFLRLNSDSTDYVIKEYDLDRIIKKSIKNLSGEFISRQINLVYEPIKAKVITDEKWLSFVVEQVLSNALKYTISGSIVIIWNDNTLKIKDTGIGIAPEDLPRIFENGYTGANGRSNRHSSGIGLYLCRRICKNLSHEITAESMVDEGTVISISFSGEKLEVE